MVVPEPGSAANSARATARRALPVLQPSAPAPAQQCHVWCQPPAACPQPLPGRAQVVPGPAQGGTGQRRGTGAGGTGAVPGALIRQDACAWLGDTLLPASHHAPLGWGLRPGGCPGHAGSSEGRQPPEGCSEPLAPLSPGPGTPPARHRRGWGDMGRGMGSAARQPGAFPPAREEGVCRQWKRRAFSCDGRAELAAAGAAGVPGRAGCAPQPVASSCSFLGTPYHRRGPPLLLLTREVCVGPALPSPTPGPKPSTPESGQGGGQLSPAGRRLPALLPPRVADERRSAARRCSEHGRSSGEGKRRAGPSSQRMVPGLLRTWPRGPGSGTVAHEPAAVPPSQPEGDAGGNLQLTRQKEPAWGLAGAGTATVGCSGHAANPRARWETWGPRDGVASCPMTPHGCRTGGHEVALRPVGPPSGVSPCVPRFVTAGTAAGVAVLPATGTGTSLLPTRPGRL